MAMVGLAVLAAMAIPAYPNLAFFLSLVVTTPVFLKLRKVQSAVESRALERRAAPVLEVIKKVGPMTSRETAYHRALIDRLFTDLSPILKGESPLPSGTTVDAWFRHDGDDWYVTVKRADKRKKEFTNQQRLTLQGEIEDILLHAPKRGKDLWVVVILAIPENASAVTLGHVNLLIEYATSRAVEASGLPRAKRKTNIEIAFVELVDVPQ